MIYLPSRIPPILGLYGFRINFSKFKRKKGSAPPKFFLSDIHGPYNVTGKW
jgi:hypothetical protein